MGAGLSGFVVFFIPPFDRRQPGQLPGPPLGFLSSSSPPEGNIDPPRAGKDNFLSSSPFCPASFFLVLFSPQLRR